jgi:MoxR-like ATPase
MFTQKPLSEKYKIMAEPILVAKRDAKECYLMPDKANRHGLITGATGTGKTITLQRLAQSFSQLGVPVFMADIKGDLTGVSQVGGGNIGRQLVRGVLGSLLGGSSSKKKSSSWW